MQRKNVALNTNFDFVLPFTAFSSVLSHKKDCPDFSFSRKLGQGTESGNV